MHCAGEAAGNIRGPGGGSEHAAANGDADLPPVGALDAPLVRGAGQEIAGTVSRCAQPRVWVRAVVWLVGAGLHPRAGERTVALARDLAGRMDYTLGTVLYDLDGTAARLGVSRATVKRHVAVLRELGALVWVRHGSKANLHLPGRRYTATATIYAAVIPPSYDVAMGHRLSGTGYDARVVGVTEAGQDRAVAAARRASGAVETRSSPGGEPHSRGRYRRSGKAEVGGELKDTSRTRVRRSTASTSPTKTSTRGGRPRRSPLQVARDIAIARQVRPLVTWTQPEHLRRLAHSLRPLIDQGQDAQGIAAELASWQYTGGPGGAWRPTQPANYITARLRDRARELAERAAAVAPQDNAAWRAYCEQRQAVALKAEVEAAAEAAAVAAARTDEDRRQARLLARFAPQQIIEHLEQRGEDDTHDLYGWRMTAWAQGLAHSRTYRTCDLSVYVEGAKMRRGRK